MSPTLILFPVFALVALTFVQLYRTGSSRVAAITRGEVKVKDIALGQSAWPDRITQLGRSYQSQFELPVLFYVLAALVLVTKRLDIVLLVLAWAFVASRFAHAYIHTTSNHVPSRFNAFLAGFVMLVAMWAWFAVRIAFATPII